MTSRPRGGALLCLAGLAVLFFCRCRGEGSGARDPALSQEQLTDPQALSERYRNSTPSDAVAAQRWLKEAREAEALRRWGAAFKLYGESALLKPSPEAILGLARAGIEIPRERAACEDTVLAKERDLQQAGKLIDSAEALARDTGQEMSVSDLATTRVLLTRAESRWLEARQRCAEAEVSAPASR